MYTPLTEQGKAFIKTICSGTGNSLLQGKNPNGILPYCEPETSPSKTWISNAKYNNKLIENNQQLGDALIEWYNKYAEMYQMNANIMAAQAYEESGYKVWNYPLTSTASGISQFMVEAMFDTIIKNPPIGSQEKMTSTEINAITKGIFGLENPNLKYNIATYSVDNITGKKNRPIIHQNIIDNPEIMIKAQFRYMKYIATLSSLASNALFGYSRGPGHVKPKYTESIIDATNSDGYEEAGIDYVYKIFKRLEDKFGIKDLGMALLPSVQKNNFDYVQADIDGSNEVDIRDIVAETLSKEPKYKFVPFPESHINKKKTNKLQITLHHTVSGEGISGDINQFVTAFQKVAVSFIIGRDGDINQLFSTNYWAQHLGVTQKVFTDNNIKNISNETLDKQSIGIEIDNWGGLLKVNNLWYPTITDKYTGKLSPNISAKPIENYIEYIAPQYPYGFHGFYAFEKYTDVQIEAIKKVIFAIRTEWKDIPSVYVNDLYGGNMWGTFDVNLEKWTPDKNALSGKPGIWTHVSYRYDKSDCHPQPELISMLKSI